MRPGMIVENTIQTNRTLLNDAWCEFFGSTTISWASASAAHGRCTTPIGSTRLSGRQATGGAKTGRNDPCPCGSGLKYKQCCGRR